MKSFAFDIYGTLIDPMALGGVLERFVGTKAQSFNVLWRDKQLEYSFRKAAMKHFNHFTECTAQALEYCDKVYDTGLSDGQKKELLDMYRKLPAFEETAPGLKLLKENNHEVIAFSNGKKEDLISLFEGAGIVEYFDQIISVDEVRTFKPAPEVYHLLAEKSASGMSTWMVSANAFDIVGAASIGLNTIWLQRNPATVFDPFSMQYTQKYKGLTDLINNQLS